MKNKNTVYTVTPPDLAIPTIGPTVLLLGVSLEDSNPYTNIYDKLFPEVEIVFYVSEDGYRPKHSAWFRAATGMASSIFVNLDNITAEEVFLAMQAEHENRATVFWVSENKTYPSMVQLLNSYQYNVFDSLQDVEKFLVGEYSKLS